MRFYEYIVMYLSFVQKGIGLLCFKFYACFISICITVSVNAQLLDTSTHRLSEVLILPSKEQLTESSKKVIEIDSLILIKSSTSSLAELLTSHSIIHIKTYGNGNIATTSMRGGNANHTALLWNGLNIQNAMLGQPDLSILPTLFFNNVTMEYGGGSANWGSGAIGGTIKLNNKLQFNQGLKTRVQVALGSFDTKKIHSEILLSYKKIATSTKLYFNLSENNYLYKDTLDKENLNKRVINANYVAKGLIQELSFFINPNQKINIRAWYNNMNRNLPANTSVISKKNQKDDNLKLNADWNFSKRNLISVIRFGYFNDKLNYNDSTSFIFSKSTIRTLIVESDNIYTYKFHTLNFGINYTQYNSKLQSLEGRTNLNTTHNLSKVAFFSMYKIKLFNEKLAYNMSIRKEYTDETSIPFTGSSGLNYEITNLIGLKINANTSYRQPTLNDLYWNPGGNPSLKPEESREVDGGIVLNYKKNRISFFVEATYFNRHTNNWIIWLPNGGTDVWSPKNIAEVYSRGLETKIELAYLKRKMQTKLIINTSYVQSTNEKKISQNDNSIGRQLIYTPRYNGNASLLIKYKTFFVMLNQSYTGYRFTSTDNTSWLNPYYLFNAKISYEYLFSNYSVEVFGSVNNVFNKNYLVVENRPMPLRNFEVGLLFQYQRKNKYNNI